MARKNLMTPNRIKENMKTYSVLANDNLLNNIAVAKADQLGMVKGRSDLASSDKSQTLNTIEISVLNRHDASISKQLLGPVVDKLSVDKAGNAVFLDLLNLGTHLLTLSTLQLFQLASALDADAGTKDLDLVSVHG